MGVKRRVLEKDPKTGEVVAIGVSLGAGLGKVQTLTKEELTLDAYKQGVDNVNAGPARKPVISAKPEAKPEPVEVEVPESVPGPKVKEVEDSENESEDPKETE